MKKDRKIFIVVGIVAVILVSFLIWRSADAPHIQTIFTFKCEKGKTIGASFNPEKVSLRLSGGRTLTLDQGVSGSGARYTNLDGSIVFWNKGETAFLEESGVETYSNCVIVK